MKRIWIVLAVIVGHIALCPYGYGADSTRVSYTDVAGTAGLTISAYLQSGCSGTPPAVTPGGTQYVLTDYGSGMYGRYLPHGAYYYFQGSSYRGADWQGTPWIVDRIDTVYMANFVTLTRMADNSVSSAEIVDGSVAAADLGTGAVTAVKVADANLYWRHLATTVKGSGADTLFTIKAMQDTQRLMKGNWTPATDYSMGALDSIIKKVVLNLAFSGSPAVTIDATGQAEGVKIRWMMNTVHNDSAVWRYRLYFATSYPSFYTYGLLDSAAQNGLYNQMDGSYKVDPARAGKLNDYFIPFRGLLYVVVTAEDWLGTVYGSLVDSGQALTGDVGTVASLIGAPGYTAGMDGMTTLRSALTDIDWLKQSVETETSRRRVLIYADNLVADNVYNTTINYTTKFYRVKTGGPPARKIAGAFCRWSGYTQLHARYQARMKTLSSNGYLLFDAWGSGNYSTQIGGLGTEADTLWRMVDQFYDVTEIAQDSTAVWQLAGLASDTMFIQNVVVWME